MRSSSRSISSNSTAICALAERNAWLAKVGRIRKTTPPHTRGPGGVIRPNAIVILDVELLDVKG
jgi:hypothetical protein